MLFDEHSKLVQTYYKVGEFCRTHKLELLGALLLVAFFIAGIPWLMEHLIIRNNYKSVIENSEWVGFLSSYLGGVIGGFITLGGVFLTLRFYRKQDNNKFNADKKKKMTSLYWFFKFKVDIVEAWHDIYEDVDDEEPVMPIGDLITDEDFTFCFDRLEGVQEIFGQESAKKMMKFYSDLDSLQWVYYKLKRYNEDKERYNQESLLSAYNEFKNRLKIVRDKIEGQYKEELEDIRKYINDEPLG